MGKASKVGIAALRTAVTQLGVKEAPPGSNWGPVVKTYLASVGWYRPAPWCQAFVHWCFSINGVGLGGGASVGNFLEWAKAKGYVVTRPFRGDVVVYNFDENDWPDHAGIAERILSVPGLRKHGLALVIEGNTSLGNDADGGQVQRRTRRLSRCKFVRIP